MGATLLQQEVMTNNSRWRGKTRIRRKYDSFRVSAQ